MSKETKTAEEYYKEFYRLDEQGELTNQDFDIINCMQEYDTIRLKAQDEKHKEEMLKFAQWFYWMSDNGRIDNGRFTRDELIEMFKKSLDIK